MEANQIPWWLTEILRGSPVALVVVVGIVWLRFGFDKLISSYMGEKGKTLARKEDLGTLVDEVRAFTTAAETIKTKLADQTEVLKAQLSQDAWDRQQRWLKRSECYVELVNQLHRYVDACILLQVTHKALMAYTGPKETVLYLHQLTKHNDAMEDYNQVIRDLKRAKCATQLMCRREVLKDLEAFTFPKFDDTNLEAVVAPARVEAEVIANGIVRSARVDLGYEAD